MLLCCCYAARKCESTHNTILLLLYCCHINVDCGGNIATRVLIWYMRVYPSCNPQCIYIVRWRLSFRLPIYQLKILVALPLFSPQSYTDQGYSLTDLYPSIKGSLSSYMLCHATLRVILQMDHQSYPLDAAYM